MFGWACCNNIDDRKPAEKRASDETKLMSLCLDNFDVHGSHSPWFPFLHILTDLPSWLVTPSPSLQPALQAEARERFLLPVSLDVSDPTGKTLATACSTLVSRGKEVAFSTPTAWIRDPVR